MESSPSGSGPAAQRDPKPVSGENAGKEGEGEPSTRKRKFYGRAKVSCEACRANKQRCGAAEEYPCKRCQLYGIDCVLQEGAAQKILPTAKRARGSPEHDSSRTEEHFAEVSERLARIEHTLQRMTHHPPGQGPPSGSHSPVSPVALELHKHSADTLIQADDGALQQVRTLTKDLNKIFDEGAVAEHPPDALNRGILDEQYVTDLFAFYFGHLDTNLPSAQSDVDSDWRVVQRRSPLLFNTILLAAAYYTLLGDEQGRNIYNGLSHIETELLGAASLFCHSRSIHMGLDTIRALSINITRKPIQYAGSVSLAQQFTAKLDTISVQTQMSLMMRFSFIHDIKRTTEHVLVAARKGRRASDEEVCVVRTWITACVIDSYGSFQSGRLPTSKPVEDDSLIEIIPQLRGSQMDKRLAAAAGSQCAAYDLRTYLADVKTRPGRVSRHGEDLHQLDQWEKAHEAWFRVWQPVLPGDPTIYILSRFIKLQLRSRFISMWIDELTANGAAQPYAALTAEQREIIRLAVVDAAEALFYLSYESRTSDDVRGRRPLGSASLDQPLKPDPMQAQLVRHFVDAYGCVMIPTFPLFLVSQVGKAINSNLQMLLPNDPYSDNAYILPNSKLARLLDLAVEFLETAAPNTTHPMIAHSRMLHLLRTKHMVQTPQSVEFLSRGQVLAPVPDEQPQQSLVDMLASYMDPYSGVMGYTYPGYGYTDLSADGLDWSQLTDPR